MSVYVAGSSSELERAERVIGALRDGGVEITHDWTRGVRDARERGIVDDASLSPGEAYAAAREDHDAVRRSDAFLLLAPTTPTRGAWVELGLALASVPGAVVVSGAASGDSIFTRLADRIFHTDDAAVAWLTEGRP